MTIIHTTTTSFSSKPFASGRLDHLDQSIAQEPFGCKSADVKFLKYFRLCLVEFSGAELLYKEWTILGND